MTPTPTASLQRGNSDPGKGGKADRELGWTEDGADREAASRVNGLGESALPAENVKQARRLSPFVPCRGTGSGSGAEPGREPLLTRRGLPPLPRQPILQLWRALRGASHPQPTCSATILPPPSCPRSLLLLPRTSREQHAIGSFHATRSPRATGSPPSTAPHNCKWLDLSVVGPSARPLPRNGSLGRLCVEFRTNRALSLSKKKRSE